MPKALKREAGRPPLFLPLNRYLDTSYKPPRPSAYRLGSEGYIEVAQTPGITYQRSSCAEYPGSPSP